MKLPDDQERLKGLLQETITLLCKNGLNYKAEFSVEALIVVTLDQEQMFHANIKETVAKEGVNISLELEESPPSKSNRHNSRKSARKRRGHREDSPEVPKKKSNSHPSEDVSQDIPQDDDEDYDEHSNASYAKAAEGEDSSECVFVKDEQKLQRGPVPLSDLEYVDQSGEQYSQQQQGVWSVEHGDGVEGGEGSQQGEAGQRMPTRAKSSTNQRLGMRLPTKSTPTATRQTRQTSVAQPEKSTDEEEDETPSVKIDTRGSVMQFAATDANGTMVKRGAKWFKSPVGTPYGQKMAGSPKGETGQVSVMRLSGRQMMREDIKGTGGRSGAGEFRDEDDESFRKAKADGASGEYFDLRPEVVSVVAASGKADVEENLGGIIKQAVSKVRLDISSPQVHTMPTSASPKSGRTGTRRRRRAPSPEIKVPRGRPINPAVTSLPLVESESAEGTPEAADSGVKRQPIKVLTLDKSDGKRPKPQICHDCGIVFTSEQSLRDHQCGEKNLFRCGVCDAMFMRKENLKKHFELHKGEVQVEVLESK